MWKRFGWLSHYPHALICFLSTTFDEGLLPLSKKQPFDLLDDTFAVTIHLDEPHFWSLFNVTNNDTDVDNEQSKNTDCFQAFSWQKHTFMCILMFDVFIMPFFSYGFQVIHLWHQQWITSLFSTRLISILFFLFCSFDCQKFIWVINVFYSFNSCTTCPTGSSNND